MDTKGERRERKKESLKRKTSDNRKSVNLILDLIRRRSASIRNSKKGSDGRSGAAKGN